MRLVTFTGPFIVRRPGPQGPWQYLTPGRQRVALGPGASTTWPRWSRHRSQARRFPTRRDAWRYLHRERGAGPGVQVVRVASWYGPLSDADLPRQRQAVFPFLTHTTTTGEDPR
jgi:hypothetical protein